MTMVSLSDQWHVMSWYQLDLQSWQSWSNHPYEHRTMIQKGIRSGRLVHPDFKTDRNFNIAEFWGTHLLQSIKDWTNDCWKRTVFKQFPEIDLYVFAASCFGISSKTSLNTWDYCSWQAPNKNNQRKWITPTSGHYANQDTWQCFCQDPKELLVANVAAHGYVTKLGFGAVVTLDKHIGKMVVPLGYI